jgi:hypothetical protein
MRKLLIAAVLAATITAQAQTNTADAATNSVPLVTILPTGVTNETANVYAAIFGKFAKRITLGGGYAVRLNSKTLTSEAESATSIDAIYEIWQPVWNIKPDRYQVQFGIGGSIGYIPSWSETDIGAGVTIDLIRFDALQATLSDGTIAKKITPSLLVKAFIAIEVAVDGDKPGAVVLHVGGSLPLN